MSLAQMIMESMPELDFKGYYSVDDGEKPEKPEIYCIYRANSDGEPVELLYIGESENIKERFIGHEHYEDWEGELLPDENLVFSYAVFNSREIARKRAEAALIFAHKPVCNKQSTETFGYDTTTVTTKGKNAFLCPKFIVRKNERSK